MASSSHLERTDRSIGSCFSGTLFLSMASPPDEVDLGWSNRRGAQDAVEQRYLQDYTLKFERMRTSWRRNRERISFLEEELSSLHKFVVHEAEGQVQSWERLLSSDLLKELQDQEHIKGGLRASALEKSLRDRELRLSELNDQLAQVSSCPSCPPPRCR